MNSIQAPQYRQFALISDFLDLANLSIREEATSARGPKLQYLALATITHRPSITQLSKEYDCRCSTRSKKCESSGSGKQLILHGNPSANARDFSPHMSVLRRHFLPNMQFDCCMILQGTLGGKFDIFAGPVLVQLP